MKTQLVCLALMCLMYFTMADDIDQMSDREKREVMEQEITDEQKMIQRGLTILQREAEKLKPEQRERLDEFISEKCSLPDAIISEAEEKVKGASRERRDCKCKRCNCKGSCCKCKCRRILSSKCSKRILCFGK